MNNFNSLDFTWFTCRPVYAQPYVVYNKTAGFRILLLIVTSRSGFLTKAETFPYNSLSNSLSYYNLSFSLFLFLQPFSFFLSQFILLHSFSPYLLLSFSQPLWGFISLFIRYLTYQNMEITSFSRFLPLAFLIYFIETTFLFLSLSLSLFLSISHCHSTL